MKQKALSLTLLLSILVSMTGCSSPDQSQTTANSLSPSETTTAAGKESDQTTVSTTSTETTAASTTTGSTATAAEMTDGSETTTAVTTTARFPAEDGDYGEFDTPHPMNFMYYFTVEGVSLRLDGGNYQNLDYPLSAETAAALSDTYIIQDCNFDSAYDLLLPVVQSNDGTTFVLFVWDAATQHYCEDGIELRNPVFHADAQEIHSSFWGSTTEYSHEIYRWNGNTLQLAVQYIMNLDRLTLTTLHYENGMLSHHTIESYPDAASLEALMNML